MRFFFTFTRTALRLLGVRLAMLVFLTGTATLTEGLGVSLFLPLLQGTETDSTLNKAMNRIFEAIDLPFEFRFILIAMVLFFFLRTSCYWPRIHTLQESFPTCSWICDALWPEGFFRQNTSI